MHFIDYGNFLLNQMLLLSEAIFYGIIFAQALGMKVLRKVDKPEYKVKFSLAHILAIYYQLEKISCVGHSGN